MNSVPPTPKILYVITKSNFGGAQRYVFELAVAMQEAGYRVAVACGGEGELVERLKKAEITTFAVSGLDRDISVFKELKALYSLAKIIYTFDPDIIHLNSGKAGLLGSFLARLLFVPRIIFTAHGWSFLESRKLSWRVVVWLGSYLTAVFSHAVIVVSENDNKQTKMPGVKNKLYTVHTAVADFPLYSREDARLKLLPESIVKEHQHNMWLVTNAELNPNKNHPAAIDAVAEFNSSHTVKIFYTIIGSGDSEADLKEQVQLRGLSDYVFFTGYRKNARQFLLAFDIFLLSSKKEGLPYALLEAGLAQIPCVASKVGGISEVISDKESGLLINPDNHSTIVTAFDYLLSNPDERSHFADNLYTHIKENYSLEKMIQATKVIYKL